MRPSQARFLVAALVLVLMALTLRSLGPGGVSTAAQDRGWTLVAWSDRGVHGMDADYSIYAIQPPGNTIFAQLMEPGGDLIEQQEDFSLTYEAIADPSGSINSSSAGKRNFWQHASSLFGRQLPADEGLFGKGMPGAGTVPMTWDGAAGAWIARGIPITPEDDAGRNNPYPLMRVSARDGDERLLASADVVLPVSDELSCSSCHKSGGSARAEPAAGWVRDPAPERDYRLNILRLHDERQGGGADYREALAALSYRAEGLEATVTQDGKAVLCAGCHASEPLDKAGRPGLPPLPQAMHQLHARERDPDTGLRLDDIDNRQACYSCHPGDATQHLRGVMGMAVADSGARAMQCESCHGTIREVGQDDRQAWLEEPTCGSCHSGTATRNAGEIRYSTVWDAGARRKAAHPIFDTEANTPEQGQSLYRFSRGHGDLYCAACHGSTHAEYPSRERNDNLQAAALQGHSGTVAECEACHEAGLNTVDKGPHGMHPMNLNWARRHGDAAEDDLQACRACHGADDRGTVLSRAQADRSFDMGREGRLELWRGFQVGCYNCHDGPRTERRTNNRPAVVQDAQARTSPGRPVSIPLQASDADGDSLALRIVSQPVRGTVGIQAETAIYYPDASFVGSASFTFAAWDGSTDSNLGRAEIQIDGSVEPSATPAPTRPGLTPTITPSRMTPAPSFALWLPYLERRD